MTRKNDANTASVAKEPHTLLKNNVEIFVDELNGVDNAIALNVPMRENFFGIFYIIKGEMDIKVNFKSHRMSTRQLSILAPMSLTEVTRITPDFTSIGVIFSPDFFADQGVYLNHPQILEIFISDNVPLIDLSEAEQDSLVWLMKRLKSLKAEEEMHLFKREAVRHTFLNLIYDIGHLYRKYTANRATKLSRKEHLVIQFFEAVFRYCKTERSVHFYADLLYITRKYLTKTVKEVTGRTPGSFIDEAILQEAKIMLSDPKFSINEVAYKLNFADQSAFGRFFKKLAGITPSFFRA